jgi:hypothetical protein
VIADPAGEFFPRERSGRETKKGCLLIVHGASEFEPVQDEKSFHRRMGNPFVSVSEPMIQGEGLAEGGRLLDWSRIEVNSAERHPRLGDGRLDLSPIQNSR